MSKFRYKGTHTSVEYLGVSNTIIINIKTPDFNERHEPDGFIEQKVYLDAHNIEFIELVEGINQVYNFIK